VREDAWLGERLGRSAWTVEDEDMIDGLAAPRAGFLQARVTTEDVPRVGALESAGFHVIDVNVTMRRESGLPLPECPQPIRDARAADRDAVTAIAERELTVSRFHLDPAIPDGVAHTIKRDWADNYFRGARGDRLLVAEHSGRVSGFALVLDTAQAAVIDLIAVASEHRGRGFGRALVSKLVESSPGRPIMAGTQVANIPAVRLYERLGFMVAHTHFVLHRHAPVSALPSL
jgi:dTDP-4-amino-4,6-dideoxy-D-galactose acyltransferase